MKVKAYLHKDGQLKEIRRFDVVQVIGKSLYELLLKEIREVFKIEPQWCNLCYKDDEEDMVAFSSQKELAHGLQFIKNDTFHMHINQPS